MKQTAANQKHASRTSWYDLGKGELAHPEACTHQITCLQIQEVVQPTSHLLSPKTEPKNQNGSPWEAQASSTSGAPTPTPGLPEQEGGVLPHAGLLGRPQQRRGRLAVEGPRDDQRGPLHPLHGVDAVLHCPRSSAEPVGGTGVEMRGPFDVNANNGT